MKNKHFNILIIISIILFSFTIIIEIEKKENYIKNYIQEQMSIFNTPIPFIHKIQYFYDRALIDYLENKKDSAIKNLNISKSFIVPTDNPHLKNITEIIDNTIQNIKNNETFDYKKREKELYLNLTSITHEYYYQTHNIIKSLNDFINYSNKTNIILQILIVLLALALILSFILYNIKEQTKNDSLIDPLTNAFNRRSFFNDIKKLPLNTHTLVMTDIDHFKKINDTYGHNIGDFVLKEFVKILKEHIRKEDKVYRWGGEEFLILFKNMSLNQAYEKIKNIKENIENHNFKNIKITASFGIKEIVGKPSNEDLKIIDNALYISKKKGRNTVTLIN